MGVCVPTGQLTLIHVRALEFGLGLSAIRQDAETTQPLVKMQPHATMGQLVHLRVRVGPFGQEPFVIRRGVVIIQTYAKMEELVPMEQQVHILALVFLRGLELIAPKEFAILSGVSMAAPAITSQLARIHAVVLVFSGVKIAVISGVRAPLV